MRVEGQAEVQHKRECSSSIGDLLCYDFHVVDNSQEFPFGAGSRHLTAVTSGLEFVRRSAYETRRLPQFRTSSVSPPEPKVCAEYSNLLSGEPRSKQTRELQVDVGCLARCASGNRRVDSHT